MTPYSPAGHPATNCRSIHSYSVLACFITCMLNLNMFLISFKDDCQPRTCLALMNIFPRFPERTIAIALAHYRVTGNNSVTFKPRYDHFMATLRKIDARRAIICEQNHLLTTFEQHVVTTLW